MTEITSYYPSSPNTSFGSTPSAENSRGVMPDVSKAATLYTTDARPDSRYRRYTPWRDNQSVLVFRIRATISLFSVSKVLHSTIPT